MAAAALPVSAKWQHRSWHRSSTPKAALAPGTAVARLFRRNKTSKVVQAVADPGARRRMPV